MNSGNYGDELSDLKQALGHLAAQNRKSCVHYLRHLAASQGEDSYMIRGLLAAVHTPNGALARHSDDLVGFSLAQMGLEAQQWPAPALRALRVSTAQFKHHLWHRLQGHGLVGDNELHLQLQKAIAQTEAETALASMRHED